MTFADYGDALVYIELAHQAAHELDFDPQDVLAVNVGHRDFLLIGLGLAMVAVSYPCLWDENADLQDRLLELAMAQKPEWLVGLEDDDDADGD